MGKAVRIDETTLKTERGKYERVCGKVNLSAPFVPFISILRCRQRFENEGLFFYLF